VSAVVGVVGLVASLLLGISLGDESGGLRRFYFAYLIAFASFLGIALGGLFFVMIQHLTGAGWSVNIRRIMEAIVAGAIPTLAVLSIPILVSVLSGDGSLYRWAWWVDGPVAHHDDHAAADGKKTDTAAGNHGEDVAPAHHAPDASGVHHHPSKAGVPKPDELTWHKRPWLNPVFFSARLVLYFIVWTALALFFWRRSVAQDADGDVQHSLRMQAWSAPGLVIFAITTTFAGFDLLMSLDPHWYSTMYGVYFFAGGVQAFFAVMVIALWVLQRAGYIEHSVTVEHRHDLGKFLFGFTFFFGYIAFSQYMLLWYASIPETVMWLTFRGATTHTPDLEYYWPYTVVALLIVVGRFALPFAGLLSRHVKRHRTALFVWSVWIVLFHFVDVFWQVMPEMDGRFRLGLPEIAALLGVGGLVTAGVTRRLVGVSLRPVHDPRVQESLAFQNI
jgi:hypothetical protein